MNKKELVRAMRKKLIKKNIKEVIKLINKDIKFQKKFLKNDYEKDKAIKWRITGMIKLKKDLIKLMK